MTVEVIRRGSGAGGKEEEKGDGRAIFENNANADVI